jgi:hypothetical protein
VEDRQWSTAAVLRNNFPREEMANTSLYDEVFVIHVLGRRIESRADIITRKAGCRSFQEKGTGAVVQTVIPSRDMQGFCLEQQCQVWIRFKIHIEAVLLDILEAE